MPGRRSNTLTLMLNVGPGELIAISMVALIVLGPQRLPDALRKVGQFMGEIRKMSTGFQDEIRNAFDADEVEQANRTTKTSPAKTSPAAATAQPIDTTAADAPEPNATDAPEIETATEAPAVIESEDDASDPASTPTESTNDVPPEPGRDAS